MSETLELKKEQCFVGLEKSLRNAEYLIEDATLLFNKGSFGYSVALSVLAIEECGKALLLDAVYKGKTKLDKELFNIVFKKHVVKLYTSFFELALSERFTDAEIEYIKTLSPTLDQIKQRGFYVDFLNGKWITPQDDDLKEIAGTNLDYAKRIHESIKSYKKL